MRKIALALMLALSIGAATTALPESQSAAPALDPAWKAPEVIAFIGVKKGDKVADIIAGRLTASLAEAVGPTGKVYAIETAEIAKVHPEGLTMEVTRKGWSERKNVIGDVLKFGVFIQRVRIPPGQSADPQAGSEPCAAAGNCSSDT